MVHHGWRTHWMGDDSSSRRLASEPLIHPDHGSGHTESAPHSSACEVSSDRLQKVARPSQRSTLVSDREHMLRCGSGSLLVDNQPDHECDEVAIGGACEPATCRIPRGLEARMTLAVRDGCTGRNPMVLGRMHFFPPCSEEPLTSPRLALLCFALLFALRAIGSSSELVLVPANQALVGTVGEILLHMCHKAVELGPRRSAWTEASTRC